MKKFLIVAGLMSAFILPQTAAASLYNFSYQLISGDILAGKVDATLQADNNTLVINSVLDFVTFNGTPQVSLPYVASLDYYSGFSSPLLPELTLNGSFMDFLACTNSDCTTAFTFGVNNAYSASVGSNFYASNIAFGNISGGEVYNQSNWQISAVPEPAILSLLTLGAIVFGWRQRKAGRS